MKHLEFTISKDQERPQWVQEQDRYTSAEQHSQCQMDEEQLRCLGIPSPISHFTEQQVHHSQGLVENQVNTLSLPKWSDIFYSLSQLNPEIFFS